MKCRLCQSDQLKMYYTQGNEGQYKFYKCQKCGLVNLDIDNLNTTEHQEKYADAFPDPFNKELNWGSHLTYMFIKEHIPTRGVFFDIGCGNGALLLMARNDGWQVKGLEILPSLAKKITEKLDIEVITNDFLKLEKSSEQFDLLALRHVLEHIPDSILAMQKINMLLKMGAYAVLEFPNIEGFTFKMQRLMTKLGLHKRKYSQDYVPGHCNEFSRRSFNYLAQITGFEMVRWETYSLKSNNYFLYKILKTGSKARVLIRKIV